MFACGGKQWFKSKRTKYDDKELDQIWPPYGSDFMLTEHGKRLLHKSQYVQKPDISDIDVESLIEQSLRFPIKASSRIIKLLMLNIIVGFWL